MCRLFLARFKIGEPSGVSCIWIKFCSLWFWAYFSFQCLAHGSLGSFSHLHHNSAPRAWLAVDGSCRFSPPRCLGLHNLFHAISDRFFFSEFPDQRKAIWMTLIFCNIPLGAGRMEIIYCGMAWRTALVKTNLLAKLRALCVQRWHLFSRLAKIFS